ncbi:MAG: hypothetical protein AAF532_09265 [Planctomycetota bacterium]
MSRPKPADLRALALCVGEDLDGLSEAEIATKVRECPNCREQWNRLQNARSALAGLTEGCDIPHDSVWPDVAPRLRTVAARRATQTSWLQASAATAVAVAGLVMVGRWVEPSAAPRGADFGFGPADGRGVEVDVTPGRPLVFGISPEVEARLPKSVEGPVDERPIR